MITLFQDKVLIKRDPQKTMESGIHLPDIWHNTSFEPFTGTVVNVGPGKVFCAKDKDGGVTVKRSIKSLVKIGDRVLVQKNSEYEIKINGEWLTLVKEQDIFGVLDDTD